MPKVKFVYCDLCSNPRDENKISHMLCTPCAESIARLMKVAEWEANRPKDRKANVAQADQLRGWMNREKRYRI